jgi:hypothetical protein
VKNNYIYQPLNYLRNGKNDAFNIELLDKSSKASTIFKLSFIGDDGRIIDFDMEYMQKDL